MTEKNNYKKLIIFCGSPTEMTAERQIVQAVEQRLNDPGQTADKAGVVLEVWDWQKHVSPDAGRPESVTLAQLQPEKWDIFIGLLWLKFGSRSGANHPHTGAPFESGTDEEFTYAYDHWKQTGRPRIWFYRCTRPTDPDVLDLAQFQRVKDFFAQCQADAAHPLFYRVFKTAEEFKDHVHADLTKFLLAEYEKRLTAPLSSLPVAAPKPTLDEIDQHRRRYLRELQTRCNLLPLAIIDKDRNRDSAPLELDHVYIHLNTTEFIDKTGQALEGKPATRERQEDARPLPLLAAAAQNETLVILGDPGSGKSSFVNHLMYVFADHLLDPAKTLPSEWPHGALLPVRLLLRELAVTLESAKPAAMNDKNTEQTERELSRLVHAHLAAHLTEYDAPDFAEALRQAIEARRCCIVFDGLDEVPTAQRRLVIRSVKAFCAGAKGNRFLVTCRIRSYDGESVLAGMKTVTLAPFDDGQIMAFIENWYKAQVEHAKQFTAAQAELKKADLLQTVQLERLPRSLVQNPLLLTTLATMHSNNYELPRQKVTLYRNAGDLLLRRWQEHRAGKLPLLEKLGLKDDVKIYHALWELGYFAQQAERGNEAADIPETEALQILARHFSGVEKPWAAAEHFLDFVDQTAGLLIGRGGVTQKVYAFPHRTFQEYFAGCYLTKVARDFKRDLLQLLPQGDYWRLTAQLAVEEILYNAREENRVLDLIYFLCPDKEPRLTGDEPAWRGVLWAAHFVLEIGISRVMEDSLGGGGKAFLARLQQRLVTILENGLLPARERAEAGFALGKLGDSRLGVCSLPPVWVDLPGGRFTMGDDEYGPPHEVELSPFKISKYPITNAQFAEFVKAGGYDDEKWWGKDGWKYRQDEEWREPRLWNDKNFNLPNQPVVGVSWFEVEAFCLWLFEKSKEQKENGKQIIRLPTEAEWEFAARGSEGRKFPWGDDEPTVEHANYNELKLDRTTVVGSFPRGATSPSSQRNNSATDDDRQKQILDLAGNVWEWCSDWYSDKYYAKCKKFGVLKNPAGPKSGSSRILRGGPYWGEASGLRGSSRNHILPAVRFVNIGFRVRAGESYSNQSGETSASSVEPFSRPMPGVHGLRDGD